MLFESFQEQFKASVSNLIQTGDSRPVYTVLASQERQHYENDIKVLIDTILRESMVKLSCVSEINIKQIETLLKLSIEFARVEDCSVNLPTIILGELFDCRTLQECELLFTFVDSNLTVWKEDFFFKNVKNHLLRICNDLLRRLSRNQNTVFCGRILIFLANFFPLFERSGLNLTSEFNQDNSTTYALQADGDGQQQQQQQQQDGTQQSEENNSAAAAALNESKSKEDLNFYRKFWQLQEYFRNPTICYAKGNFKAFQTHCTDVLSVFAGNKIDADSGFYFQTLGLDKSGGKENSGNSSNNSSNNNSKEDTTANSASNFFFVKYLTNQKLLELQLSDSNFRRHILIQMLILFQYFTATVKFRPEGVSLSEEQTAWLVDARRKVYACVEETPPNGKEVVKVLEHLLRREEYWNHWKNEGCKEELKAAIQSTTTTSSEGGTTSTEGAGEGGAEGQGMSTTQREAYIRATYAAPAKRARLGEYLRSTAGTGKLFLGNADMNRLWNFCPDNLEACRSGRRDFTPNIPEYFESWGRMSPEEKGLVCEDSNHCWRTLRLLSAKCSHFFVPSNVVVKYVKDYLHGVTDRLAAELTQSSTSEGFQGGGRTASSSGATNEDDGEGGGAGAGGGGGRPHKRAKVDGQQKESRKQDAAKLSGSGGGGGGGNGSGDTEDIISDDELLKNVEEEEEEEAENTEEEGGGGASAVQAVPEDEEEEEEEEEDMDDLNQIDSGANDSPAPPPSTTPEAGDLLTPALIEQATGRLAEHWDVVSPFFGYQEDEIEYIKENFPEGRGRMRHLITIWKDEQEPEQATLKALQAILAKARLEVNLLG